MKKAPARVLGTDSKSDRESCSGARPDLVETHFAVLAGRDVGGDGEAERCRCIVGILWGHTIKAQSRTGAWVLPVRGCFAFQAVAAAA